MSYTLFSQSLQHFFIVYLEKIFYTGSYIKPDMDIHYMLTKDFAWLTVVAIVLGFAAFFYFIKDSYLFLPYIRQGENQFIQPASWENFESTKGKFKVLFPFLPQHASDTIIDPKTKEVKKYDMYVSQMNNGTIFMVTLVTYPHVNLENESSSIMKSFMNEIVKQNSQNKLDSVSEEKFDGFNAITFKMTNDEITLVGKEFIRGNTLYYLSSLSKNSLYLPEQTEHFFKSFQLTDKLLQEPIITPFPPQP